MNTDKMLLKITSIKKLKMVHFYHLFGENGPMYGILVYYMFDVINLCNADPYFDELFDKIVSVYKKEAPTNSILANEETKGILENAISLKKNDYQTIFSGFLETKMPIILPKAFSHIFLLPLVKYIITSIYGGDQESLQFSDLKEEWFGKGVMNAMLKNSSIRLPYRISQENDEDYEITVCHVLTQANELCIHVHFGGEGMIISYHDTIYNYRGGITVSISDENTIYSHELKQQNTLILNSEIYCEQLKKINLSKTVYSLCGENTCSWKFWTLPWGSIACHTMASDIHNRIIMDYSNNTLITRIVSCKKIFTSDSSYIDFGCFNALLYECPNAVELHLLDMDYPRASSYIEHFAGKFYSKESIN